MKKVTIDKGFLLTTNGGDRIPFKPGVYELEDDIADHWYVKAHSVGDPEQLDPPTEPVSEPEISETTSRKKPKRRIIDEDSPDGEEEETE